MTRYVIVFCLLLAAVAQLGAARRRKKVSAASKIVGGSRIDITEVPYQVSLRYKDDHYCGGSIIGARHILTAAHCVSKGTTSDYSIRAGSTQSTSGGEIRKVSKITKHPNYNSDSAEFDAAVIELNEPITHTKAKAIALAKNEPQEGAEVLLSGWGAMEGLQSSVRNLRGVTVPVLNRITCRNIYKNFNPVTENMFCAGHLAGGMDACKGDSGGPALVSGRLAGITSWGAGCGEKNAPGVYTNIYKIRSWIEKQTLKA